MKKILFLLLLIPSIAVAQSNDEELAAYYFSNKEYDKAAEMYDKLLKKDPSSNYIYNNYLVCLLELKDYKEAEKTLEKQIKRFPYNYVFQIDLAYVYQLQGEDDKAEKEYQKPLDNLRPSGEDVTNLANAYLRRGKKQLALNTYLKARKMLRDNYAFTFEVAELMGDLGQKEKMYEEYLNLLDYSPGYYKPVVDKLDIIVSGPEDYELVKTQVLLKVQKNPNNEIYNDLMLWLFIRQKDFNSAYIQTKAIDKRKKEEGKRLMQLAYLCKQNEDYEVAAKCFDYVASLGSNNMYYLTARIGALDIKYTILTKNYNFTDADLLALEKEYLDFLDEYGQNPSSSQSIYQLCEMYIQYMNKTDEAITMLKNITENMRVSKVFLAESKLLLGDAYLVKGRLWLARAQYSQVDYEYDEDELGQEARFRKAKVDYYQGDFVWAQAQLDILKSATTRFISNNAIDLSLLIQDNTGLDSTEDAMKMYARADLLIYQNRLDEAIQTLDSIPTLYPKHSLSDEIYYAKAHIMVKRRDYTKAIEFYQKIITDFSEDILGDNAIFELAKLYDERLKNHDAAMELYEKILLDCPGSLFTVDARKRYRELRGDNL